MYKKILHIFNMLNNKLFCTFTHFDNIPYIINHITNNYHVIHNKIFILELSNNEEYAITYNIEESNHEYIPENSVLIHRKKEYNVLYTINALNELIRKLNDGVVDSRYRINWGHYKNSILLTQQNELKHFKTKIHKILEV